MWASAPTGTWQEMRCEEESPSHGFAVPAPFRQGGQRDGERIATASVRTGFAMTGSFTWGAVDARAGRPGGRPLRKCILRCVGEGLCPSRGRGRTPPLRKRYMRCGADKGRPGGPPLRFFISTFYILYPLFICALRRINLPGVGVCPCRPTRCGPRPGAFPGRWLFPPGRSRCGVRPGSPGPGL